MKRYLYIYNPYSGAQSAGADLDKVLGICYSNGIHVIPHRLFTMENDTVLDELLADTEHFDGVLILGGDGTVGQVIDKMLKFGNHTPVGIIPGGTCNDFARNLMMPLTVSECAAVFCRGKTAEIDLLKVKTEDTEMYVCNSVAAGVFVGVSHTTSPEFKKVFGSFAYYISAVGELTDMKPFHITVETPEETLDTDALVFVVLNGTDVAGMKNMISDAILTDGKMNIMVVKDGNMMDRASAGISVLSHKSDKSLLALTTEKCKITVDRPLSVSVDGEEGPNLPYEIEVIPRGLTVFVPEAFSSEEQ